MKSALPATEAASPLPMDVRQVFLAQFPIFNALAASDLEEALRAAHVRRVLKGSTPFATNSPCMGFSMLLDGTIRVVKLGANGREVELYRLQPGESCLISSSCMLGKANYSATAVAQTDLLVFTIPPTVFKSLMARNEAFREFVFSQFSQRLADLMMLVEAIAFQKLDQRLAHLLLEEGPELKTSHAKLADRLGTVRDIVGRLLKNFEQRGLVSLGRERVRVLDDAGLKEVADRPA
ncbi:MAG: Crp/Fnr family transcriptional regulator [Pseudomonadota bacterium]